MYSLFSCIVGMLHSVGSSLAQPILVFVLASTFVILVLCVSGLKVSRTLLFHCS